MITDRASGQSAAATRAMPRARPSSPSARDAPPPETPASRPAVSGTASGAQMPTLENPSSNARAIKAVFQATGSLYALVENIRRPGCETPGLGSEIQISIMRRRRKARHLIHQQRPETGPRFDLGIPVLHHRMPVPIHIRYVIQARQMRRRSEIGQRHLIARQPAPLIQKPAPDNPDDI